jgi:hypothetical protein
MPSDKTMPPVSDNLDAPAMDAPMGAPDDMAPPSAPQDGGSVMISIPKAVFDSMHQIVMQLASGLDQLAKDVNQQAAGPKAPEAAPQAPAAPEGGNDEDFLNSMAEEGSARSR